LGHLHSDKTTKYDLTVISNLLQRQGFQLEDVFAEFAARTVNFDHDYGERYRHSEMISLARMQSSQPMARSHDNKIAATYGEQGSGSGWMNPPQPTKVGAWAYNVYRINVPAAAQARTYTFGVRSDASGPAGARFIPKVAVTRGQSIHYIELGKINHGEAKEIDVPLNPGDSAVLVIASTPPSDFSSFDAYPYSYRITKK
jgi:hypothetical protein